MRKKMLVWFSSFIPEFILIITVPLFILFILLNRVDGASSVSICTRNEAERVLKTFAPLPETSWNPHLIEVSEIRAGDTVFCEVVYENRIGNQQNVPIPRNILYYGNDFVLLGQLLLKNENGTYRNITFSKYESVNREFMEYVRKMTEQQMRTGTTNQPEKANISLSEYNKYRSLANISFTAKNATAEIVTFVDPYCPYCERLEKTLLEMNRKGKINVHFVLTPILGEASKKVSVSIICMKNASSQEKMDALSKKYQSEKLCDEGLKAVEKNREAFTELKARGVPFSLLKKGDKVFVLSGAVPEEYLESVIAEAKEKKEEVKEKKDEGKGKQEGNR